MVRKTVKLMGPLASLIMASSSSFFTFSWPEQSKHWVQAWSLRLRPGRQGRFMRPHPWRPARPSGRLCWWCRLCSGRWLWKPAWKLSVISCRGACVVAFWGDPDAGKLSLDSSCLISSDGPITSLKLKIERLNSVADVIPHPVSRTYGVFASKKKKKTTSPSCWLRCCQQEGDVPGLLQSS